MLPIEDAISGRTTHVAFEPQDFMARLAILMPRPRVNLTRIDIDITATADATRCAPEAGRIKMAPRDGLVPQGL